MAVIGSPAAVPLVPRSMAAELRSVAMAAGMRSVAAFMMTLVIVAIVAILLHKTRVGMGWETAVLAEVTAGMVQDDSLCDCR